MEATSSSESMEVMNMEAAPAADMDEQVVAFACAGTLGTLGTVCGCIGTLGTFGCAG
ncbi:hypothetical protein PRBRB14_18190 [Hallella multisaccharivorax DSM 17128]|nr:hypothetical protein PRBRB14_18190 [Hallella multisaccharivorax DSM 17128]